MISEHGCTDTTSTELCVENVYVPNAFTPNGDGLNDVFGIVSTIPSPRNYTLMIFDRWGELVWSTSDVTATWDGSLAGGKATADVYAWKLHVLDSESIRHDMIGHVALIR